MLVTQSCPTLCDPWTVACQAPSSVHWIHQARIRSGLPFPSPENLPDPGIEPGSPALQADSLPFELQERPSPPFYQVTQFLWIAHAFQRHTWNVVKLLFCSCSFVSAAAKSLQSCPTLWPDWMKHKLESRLLGEISITSDMQMIPPLWQKVKKN